MTAPGSAARTPVHPAPAAAPYPRRAGPPATGRPIPPVVLDAARPLWLGRPPGTPLTLAVVSLTWLRALSTPDRRALAGRHLTQDEAAFGAALPVPKRRAEWLAGRLALKSAVRAHQRYRLGCAATPGSRLPVRTLADGLRAGKPYVAAPVEVALTHAGDFAVAVCGPRPVGVDLERHRTVTPYLARLLTVPDGPGTERLRRMPLTLRWAAKEAVLKHYGFGLRIGGGAREVELTGWALDGRFTWRPSAALADHLPYDGGRTVCLAQDIDNYSFAMVWQT
ncbi:hypothetical protein ACF06W_30730 [Streptomyces albus]|uniref:hypothetical protein n=1 Tax=Streptomyces albus TaxID=1888 RepID=UPI0036F995BD